MIELGAGMGCYTGALLDSGALAWAAAFDGAPEIGNITRQLVSHADLTKPVHSPCVGDFVVALEVAEHIPSNFEHAFLRNVDALNSRGVIMSWSASEGGNGHVNAQPASYVLERMRALGYVLNTSATERLRASVRSVKWFKTTITRFDRSRAKRPLHAHGDCH